MKAFLSYSVNDRDHFILTLLSEELYKNGFSITQSSDYKNEMSSMTRFNIQKSQLFIGLMTGKGVEKQRVYKELGVAHSNGKPTILLIENTVPLRKPFRFPYISFDRNNPKRAIVELKQHIDEMKKKQSSGTNALAWILGGAALLAIINLLSED